ncbi:MAG: hypothetical protein RLO17_14580 [Cyclobacteriaceae bacterium]
MKRSSLFIIGAVTAAITYGSLVAALGPKNWTHGYHHHGWHHHHDHHHEHQDAVNKPDPESWEQQKPD